jgi:hypothetical protein
MLDFRKQMHERYWGALCQWQPGIETDTFDRVGRAAEKLEDAVVEMTRVATVVEANSQPMPRRDPLRKYMDIIYREVATDIEKYSLKDMSLKICLASNNRASCSLHHEGSQCAFTGGGGLTHKARAGSEG